MNNVGLGKNSPIQLRLSRQNYEALISRHGQLIRWLMADKCPCTLRSGRPDFNCSYCGGDGIRYSHQKTKVVTAERVLNHGGGMVELDCPLNSCLSVRRITDGKQDYPVAEVYDGKLVRLDEVLDQWVYLDADYEMTDELDDTAVAEYLGHDIFKVALKPIQTQAGAVYPDITDVVSLVNTTTGEQYQVDEWKRNYLYVSAPGAVNPGDVVLAKVKYLKPRVFLLLSQASNKVEQQWLDSIGGDASLTFPNEYTIAEGDVLTALVATSYQKAIITRSGTDFDRIPEWYVEELKKVEDNTQTYLHGVDFILFDRNRIMWLGDRPAAGADYSIMYSYHPTYKVLKDMPNIRSSENQLLPRRVALKLMNMGGQASEGI